MIRSLAGLTTLVVTAVFFAVLWHTEAPLPQPDNQAVTVQEDRFRSVRWIRQDLFANMTEVFGLPEEEAKAVAGRVKQITDRGEDARLRSILDNTGLRERVWPAICYDGDNTMPQPYSMLEFLVVENGGKRFVLKPQDLFDFESQSWYAEANIPGLYDAQELADDRRLDSTALTLAGIFLSQDEAVYAREGMFRLGSRGGYIRLSKDKPHVKAMIRDYLALVYVFAEFANQEGGVCE